MDVVLKGVSSYLGWSFLLFTILLFMSREDSALAQASTLSGDFTGDGLIDDTDLIQLAHRQGMERGKAGYELRYDMDQSGQVDHADVLLFQSEWYGQPAARTPVSASELRTRIGLPALEGEGLTLECAGGQPSDLCGSPGRIFSSTITVVGSTDVLPINFDHDGPGGKVSAFLTTHGPLSLVQVDVTTPTSGSYQTGFRVPAQSVTPSEPIVLAPADIQSGSTVTQTGTFDIDLEAVVLGKSVLKTSATTTYESAVTWIDCSEAGDWSLTCLQVVFDFGMMGIDSTSRCSLLFGPDGIRAVDYSVETDGEVNPISFETVPPDQAQFGDLLAVYENPTPQLDDAMSWGIGTVGPHVILGTPFDDEEFPEAGAAYFYDGATGDLLTTFNNPGNTELSFGDDVDGIDDLALVGSLSEDLGPVIRAGLVNVYDGSPTSPTFGEFLFDIPNPDPVPGGFFGNEIESDGNVLAIGAYNNEVNGVRAGKVYLFQYDPNNPAASLSAPTEVDHPEPAADDQFGEIIRFLGDGLMAVAARFSDHSGFNGAGTLYLFDADPASSSFGDHLITLQSPSPVNFELFGTSIARCGDILAVGTYRANLDTMDNFGAVFLYNGDPDSPQFGDYMMTIPNPSEGTFNEYFARGMAAFGRYLAVGTASVTLNGVRQQGAVLIYDLDPQSARFGELVMQIDNPVDDGGGDYAEFVINHQGNILVAHRGFTQNEPTVVRDIGLAYLFKGPDTP